MGPGQRPGQGSIWGPEAPEAHGIKRLTDSIETSPGSVLYLTWS